MLQFKFTYNLIWCLKAVAQFVSPKHFKSELSTTLSLLCRDPSPAVRQTVASGFHEVCKLMSHQVTMLFPDLIVLLKDENIQVWVSL
jgi:hypothetical protein